MNGALTLFKSGLGSHSFKMGGEIVKEENHATAQNHNNLTMRLNNGLPSQVRIFEDPVDSHDALKTRSVYIQDTWTLNSRVTLNLGVRYDRYNSYVPEQTGVAGRQFAQIDGPVWNNLGPRLGAVYGLIENRTVLKVNFGHYWESPFRAISATLNPNTDSVSTYEWNPVNPVYVNGLPVFVPGSQGRLLSFSGARADGRSATRLDPNLENGYSRQVTAFIEHELAPNFGLRGGFVWNGRRNQRLTFNANQPFSAFTVPVSVLDPGRDGIAGTADDAGIVQAYNLDPSYLGLPLDQVLMNTDTLDTNHYTWEITANRRQTGRWSLIASFAKTWNQRGAGGITPNDFINTFDGVDKYTTWQGKLSSNIDASWGVRVTPALRHQSGDPIARTFLARLNYNNAVQIKAEPWGNLRADHVTLLDVRVEKAFRLSRAKLAFLFDVYNITNTNANQQILAASGTTYGRPIAVAGPRIARVGLKFDW